MVGATLRARKDSKAITADDGLGERNHAAYEAFDPERHRLLHQEVSMRALFLVHGCIYCFSQLYVGSEVRFMEIFFGCEPM